MKKAVKRKPEKDEEDAFGETIRDVFEQTYRETFRETYQEAYQELLKENHKEEVSPALEDNIFTSILLGDLESVKRHVANGANLEDRTEDDNTPLLLAITLGNNPIANYLLEKNANPDVYNIFHQVNSVQMAKDDNGKHTELSKRLKRQSAIASEKVNKITAEFARLFRNEIYVARSLGKNILILLGESHGHYKVYQLEKIILKVCKELGMSTLYAEAQSDELAVQCAHNAARKMGMTVKAVDLCEDRDNATLQQRNIVISKEICSEPKNAIFIMGGDHLHGLLCDNHSKIDNTKFHIIPINLMTPEIVNQDFADSEDCEEFLFALDPNNIIQIENFSSLSDSEPVIAKWNLCGQQAQKTYMPSYRASQKSILEADELFEPALAGEFSGAKQNAFLEKR